MKIVSISDIITNSSSEVFCTITSDSKEILKEIYDFLGPDFLAEDFSGEGGTYLNDDNIEIWLSRSFYLDGLEQVLILGLRELLKNFECQINLAE